MIYKLVDRDFFWDFDHVDLDKVAVITESFESKTYKVLNDDINCAMKQLPLIRSLVFIIASNSYKSLVFYLACLRCQHPFILIDEKVDDSLLSSLQNTYQPNFLIKEGRIEECSKLVHDFHDDLAMLMSTSGSTGSPKLVRLSKINLSSNTNSIAKYLKITEADNAITTLPMSYSYGLSVINSHLSRGATVILNNYGVLTKEFWEVVDKYQVSTLSGVPFVFQTLKKLKYNRFDTSSIRYLTQAGGKLDTETLKYFSDECDKLNQSFIVMYGQTEASPRISYLPAEMLKNKIGSIGIPIPYGHLAIQDSVGTTISEPFTEGEIVYEGPNVMMGYADKPTDFSLGDISKGILHTGDLGYFDEDGYFFITGRAKRFIKMYGLRISLDSIDSWLADQEISAVAMGKDDLLILCIENEILTAVDFVKEMVSKKYKINANSILVHSLESIPRINGGKVDFKTLSSLIGL
ncbi:AMP-binding protein [Shewanella sp. MBTL60-007]|uniref:AMP-binding protein n=1 Tax=Shewanella sp. MBTL60-007 TaxID=2815911 RepID=UPI001BC19F70|nr:AMP-binding protein [Shewanella sp. MBTL60-007]GIU33275.1 hypothetical protein TUM3792_46040 [Shewanella sp. MBTL60-007]